LARVYSGWWYSAQFKHVTSPLLFIFPFLLRVLQSRHISLIPFLVLQEGGDSSVNVRCLPRYLAIRSLTEADRHLWFSFYRPTAAELIIIEHLNFLWYDQKRLTSSSTITRRTCYLSFCLKGVDNYHILIRQAVTSQENTHIG
jgi:hypothetical protein